MRFILLRTEPMQEMAAEPNTLARFKKALSPQAKPLPSLGTLRTAATLRLPMVADATIATGVVHFRPIGESDQAEWEDAWASIQAEEAVRARVAEEALRVQVRAALKSVGITQASAARQLCTSEKHLSQMLTGRVSLHLHWAERILRLCNLRLVIRSEPAAHDQPREQP